MKPPAGLADKGSAVEEWIDLRFFRPAGLGVVRAVWRTPVTADQLTVASVLVGLAGGHLFLYANWRLNALGLALLIFSDVLDSADGQMARLRGTSTRFGRTLDGIGDGVRFINLYLTIMFRLLLAGGGWMAVGLGALAMFSHSFQAAAADFIRQAYLYLGTGTGAPVDLPENLTPGSTPWRRLVDTSYRSYVERQARIFPATVALVRGLGNAPPGEALRAEYRDRQLGQVRRCAWIGQNIRWALVGFTALAGYPEGFFWLTAVPLNLVLIALVLQHEAASRLLGRRFLSESPDYERAVVA